MWYFLQNSKIEKKTSFFFLDKSKDQLEMPDVVSFLNLKFATVYLRFCLIRFNCLNLFKFLGAIARSFYDVNRSSESGVLPMI